MKHRFDGILRSHGPGGAWTFLDIPQSVSQGFAIRGRIPVCGTLNGFAFRNSLMPTGDGRHTMMFSRVLQKGSGALPGDTVEVVIELDRAQRAVEVPPDLKAALAREPKVAATFDALAPSGRRDFVDWIASAKREDTRSRRVLQTLEMVAAGKKSHS